MRWLLLLSSFFVWSCASVSELELHARQNVKSMEELFKGGGVPKTKVEIKANRHRPLLFPSRWVKVWKGSYYEGGAVSPEGWIYLELEEERPYTSF